MLTRFFSVSVASSLQEIPGATSFHSGSAHRGGTGTTGSPPVSAAIRRARRPQSDADGRSTLPEVEGLVGVTRNSRQKWAVRAMVHAFFSLLEPQPVNRSGPRLVHDPSDDGSARSIVRRRSSPDVVKHVQRQLFGGFPIVGDSHDQGEHDSLRAFIERVQRALIARGDGLNEPDPILLGYRSLRLVGKEQIAERSRRRIELVLALPVGPTHRRGIMPSLAGRVKML